MLADWFGDTLGCRTPRQRRVETLWQGYSCEVLEERQLLSVTIGALQVNDLPARKDELIALPVANTTQNPVTYSVQSSNTNVTAEIVSGGRSLALNVSGVDNNGLAFNGTLILRLFESENPTATARIIALADGGFYNGLLFHRVIDNFVAQGGDPAGNGTGGSGTKFPDEFNAGLTFTSQGLLAMANSGDDTNDSQFFITDVDLTLAQLPQHLNFQHTVFGILTGGFDTFRKLMGTPTNATTNKPLANAVINTAVSFTDTQNGVVRVHAPAGFTGSTTLTITASDGQGSIDQKQVTVNIVADAVNDRAFLGQVGNVTTKQATPVTFNVQGFDLENDPLNFVVKTASSFGADNSTGSEPTEVAVSIQVTPAGNGNPASAAITLTPQGTFSGTLDLIVGVRDQTQRGGTSLNSRVNFDTQAIRLTVTPVNVGVPTPTNLRLATASDDGVFNDDRVFSHATPTFTVNAQAGASVMFHVNGATQVAAQETSPGTFAATLSREMFRVGANTMTATAAAAGVTSPATAPLGFTYALSYENVYTVPGAFGSAQQLTFEWTSRSAWNVREFGVVTVDNLDGTIDGLSPGDDGYIAAALAGGDRQALFTRWSPVGSTETLNVAGGQLLVFYVVANDWHPWWCYWHHGEWRGRNAYFSVDAANRDDFDHLRVTADPQTGQALLHWESGRRGGDRDFNDAVITVTPGAVASAAVAEALRISGGAGRDVPVTFTLQQPAHPPAWWWHDDVPSGQSQGEFGFFVVEDAAGTVAGLQPGEAGYLQAALGGSTRQVIFNNDDPVGTRRTVQIPGGALVGWYYIPDGTAANLIATNSTNDSDLGPVALMSFDAGNPDSAEHFRWYGPDRRWRRFASSDSGSDLQLHVLDRLFASRSAFDDLLVAISMPS